MNEDAHTAKKYLLFHYIYCLHHRKLVDVCFVLEGFIYNMIFKHTNNLFLTLKEPGFLDPSHSRGISETDKGNIRCGVLVDS